MLLFDQLTIHDRGNATYDPGAALTAAGQNVVTPRTALDASLYSRMVTLNWACNPGTGTGGLVDGVGNPLWSTTMPSARANLKAFLAPGGLGAGTQPTAFNVDAQFNYMNPYDICTVVWGYKGIYSNLSGPEITQSAWARACDLARQNAWLLYDFVTAVRSIYPKKPVGVYMQPGDSQSYARWYADMGYGVYATTYPSARKWQARGQAFSAQFMGWFDFIGPSCYSFDTNASMAAYVTDITGTYDNTAPYDPLYGTALGWSPKNKWESIVARDLKWARQFGIPVIPFVSPCYHPSASSAAYYAGGVTMHADVVQDQLRFMQDDMDVFGVVLWDTKSGRSNAQSATLYNTNGIWAKLDKYAPGGASYALKELDTAGVWSL